MIKEDVVNNLFKNKFNIIPTDIKIIRDVGTINNVYLICFGRKKIIVRLRESDKYASKEFQKEAWFSKQSNELQIPAPKIFFLGSFENIDYMIEEYIYGISGNNYSNSNALFKKLGEYSKKIKSIAVSGYGLEKNEGSNTFSDDLFNSPEDQINFNIKSINEKDELINLGIYNYRDIDIIKFAFQRLLNYDTKSYLNHGDISLNNTIITPEGKIYWIDFGSVNANVLGNEFANIKFKSNSNIESFADGFGISYNEIKNNLQSYKLLSAFDKLRWSLTTNNLDYINWYKFDAKEQFENFKKMHLDREK